jgi:hypothetical protein
VLPTQKTVILNFLEILKVWYDGLPVFQLQVPPAKSLEAPGFRFISPPLIYVCTCVAELSVTVIRPPAGTHPS